MTKTILCALAAMSALLAVRVSAIVPPPPSLPSPSMVFGVSGAADFIKTNYFKFDKKGTNYVDTNGVTTTITESFDSKYIYNIISNAVANATNYSADLTATNLPADGYIALNLSESGIPDVYGLFYVTNSSGFYFPLSGVGSNDTAYSYIELDSQGPADGYFVEAGAGNPLPFFGIIGYGSEFIFAPYFNDVYKSTYDTKTGNGSISTTSAALLYIHSDPLEYDATSELYYYFENSSAIEIFGILKLDFTYKGGDITTVSGSLTGGSGNIETDDDDNGGVITKATATFTK